VRIETFQIDQIDLGDDRFRISYFFHLDKLLLSVKKIGLIYPLVITQRKNRFILVAGWKRLAVCRKLSLTSVPVFTLHEKNDVKVFLFCLYENLSHRDFSLLEKAEILSKLKGFGMDEKLVVRNIHPVLGIPATLSLFDVFLKISKLKSDEKRIIQESKMPLGIVQLLLDFDTTERKRLLPLLSLLSQNKRKQMLEDLRDLKEKEEVTVDKIFSTPGIHSILSKYKLSSLQKADEVRLYLRKKRYPTLTRLMKTVQTSLKKNRLSNAVTVDPSSVFENGEISVRLCLSDKQQCESRLRGLQKLISDNELLSLFKNISDE
jgi:ParB-like chromosome segregation protein Spo0J